VRAGQRHQIVHSQTHPGELPFEQSGIFESAGQPIRRRFGVAVDATESELDRWSVAFLYRGGASQSDQIRP